MLGTPKLLVKEFLGDPVVRTPSFHWRGLGFYPCLGN